MTPENNDDQRRRFVLLTLIVVTFVGGLFFGGLNWHRGLMLPALVEFAFAAFCLISFPLVHQTQQLQRWALTIVLLWMTAFLLIIGQPDTASSVFSWLLVLPLLVFFLLGQSIGLALSLLAVAGSIWLAVDRFGWPQSSDDIAYAANFGLALLVVIAMANAFERSRRANEEQLRIIAATDALTGLKNRSRLRDDFEKLIRLTERQRSSLSVLLIDIDHFKTINDRFGHAAGDTVLKAVAGGFRDRLRNSDHVYRMGGEEFLVLLPDTDIQQASDVAESLRQHLASLSPASDDPDPGLTVSIGVAGLGPDGTNVDALLRTADQRLYWCKANGRNRIKADDQLHYTSAENSR